MIDRSVERCFETFVDKYLELESSKIFARSVFFGSPSSTVLKTQVVGCVFLVHSVLVQKRNFLSAQRFIVCKQATEVSQNYLPSII